MRENVLVAEHKVGACPHINSYTAISHLKEENRITGK